ncbi:Hsp20/alpha crystallin family protein [Geobacter sp. AOG1]|uniref:Hsp20/alpha crystallin family protein n=1 Tax=Geobacter sp. AOG1 TaxID=1566346 RepID=UPI001CC8054B|nr:Hsp20/alpha crystallin family protein [Geobacter sp. AOG1]
MMDEMERLMEESFNRSFFSTGMLPFRRLFHELGSRGMVYPSVDVYEEKDTIVVKAELPGMERDDIDVRLMDNAIIISGEKKTEEKLERKDYFRMERSQGSFSRTLNLPSGIDTDHAKASFKDGMLEVRIPKTTDQRSGRQLKVE